MNKNKIMGIVSIIMVILGWILYSRLGIIVALLLEIGGLVVAIISNKNEKNTFAVIGETGSIILIIIMIFLLFTSGIMMKTGNDAIKNKAKEIEQSQNY